MKKLRKFKSKIIMLMLAIVLPLSTCGLIYSLGAFKSTDAETATTASYLKSYTSEISLTNNNFSSSSSSYTLSNSFTGWNGQNNDRKTTAGVINVGGSFQSYMQGTYYLSSNPLAKASDKYVMMINSKTSKTDNSAAKQGYKSSDIKLAANSYYSVQVSFKSDTNYIAHDEFLKRGEIAEETYSISSNNFNTIVDGKYTKFGEHIQISYDNSTYYILKELDEGEIDVDELAAALPQKDESQEPDETYALKDVKVFYEEEEVTGQYVGVMIGENPYYIPFEYIEKGTENELVHIKKGAKARKCSSIVYNDSTKRYVVTRKDETPVPYYEKNTTYTPYSATSFGTVYLSGLKDKDGNPVKASFSQVSSDNWVTFYFFVATGSEEQTASLELWLGSKDSSVSGVVFYDDCHVYQYSENAFWKTYAKQQNMSYTQDWTTNGESSKIETVTTDCVQLVNLQSEQENALNFDDFNFDFEAGIYNSNPTTLLAWKKDENCTGNARVFDVNSPEFFKTTTGFDFVGSDLSCTWKDSGNKLDITENQYVLALWANDGYSKITSKNIELGANEILKITAKYKVSDLSSGNAYISITEDENFTKQTYNLQDYSPAAEAQSSALSTNGDSNFVNKYAIVEFYVRGNVLYSSSFNISLSLGNSTTNATGCVIFDNIKIEKANNDQFSGATNTVTLGSENDNSGLSITNGNFNSVTVQDNQPDQAEGWTVESDGNKSNVAGIINTDSRKFEEYVRQYNKFKATKSDPENPYLWASFGNPANDAEPDNIFMLANTDYGWQRLKSSSISLTSGTTYKLSFDHKTLNLTNDTNFTVSIFGEDNFVLFQSEKLSTTGNWKTYDIYLRTFSGATNVTIQIDFGTSENKVRGLAYFDNFKLQTVNEAPAGKDVVDMTDFYLSIPSNNITDDLSTTSTPAYTLSRTSGEGEGIRGGIVSSDFFNNKPNSIFRIKGLENGEKKNVFYIECLGEGSYTIQSNFKVDLTANSYYKLSFKLKTFFNEDNLDKDNNFEYGLTAGLTGFDYATKLRSSKDYETYEIYFNPTEDANSQIYFCLICDTNLPGSMALYDLNFEESNETDYQAAVDAKNGKNFDVNAERVYSASQDTDAENDDNNSDTETTESTPKNRGNSSAWLYIPTIIFGVAIIIAVVGFFMRKIKLKKIEIKRKETYDRKNSLNVDTVKQKAKEEQAKEIKDIQEIINKFQTELDEMEKVHKQKVVNLREKDKQKVSKETDKEFKQFAQKRTVIAEKIDSLKKQIDEIKSPDYLLNLERKVFLDEEAKRRELAQYSKKEQKAAKKSSKTTEKQEKTNTKKQK